LKILDSSNLYSLSLSHTLAHLRGFLEHSSIGERKAKEGKAIKGKKRTIKKDLAQAATTRILAGIELHL